MDKPKAPAPLNPTKVAGAQLDANKDAIAQQSAANRVNQTDAYGNTLNYTQTGTDAQGNPIYSASQQLGAQGQGYAGGLFGLAQKYFGTAGQGAPGSMDGFNQAQAFYDESQAPYIARQNEALQSQLRNQGLDPNSAAFRNATGDLRNSQGQARNNFISGAQNQFFDQGMQGRQQQMNELAPGINAASTFMNPSYANVPGVNVPVADMSALYGMRQQGLNQQYQADSASYGGMLGGLGKIGGSLLTLPFGM